MALHEGLHCREDAANVSGERTGMLLADEPLSHAWFAALDEKIRQVAGVLEYLRVQPIGPEERFHAQKARQELCKISEGLRKYLATLEIEIRRLCVNRTLDRTKNELFAARSLEEMNGKRLLKTSTRHRRNIESKNGLSPGEKVMNHLFRWWRPCGSNCTRGAQRLAETRVTEVDGRLVQ